MTEITRVPLQPIAKGAVSKLWIGSRRSPWLPPVSLMRRCRRPHRQDADRRNGRSPTMDDVVLINYKGMLSDGTVFDQNKNYPNPVAQFVLGFSKALQKMQRGGKYEVIIPSELAYGATPPEGSPIPANADLKFEVELIDYKSLAEIRQQQQILQQLQQMQQGGAPGAVPGAPAPAQP
ncbi:FKBP-type peptidyl-prolyl cis-trans isomerase [Novosphingobium panipatense]